MTNFFIYLTWRRSITILVLFWRLKELFGSRLKKVVAPMSFAGAAQSYSYFSLRCCPFNFIPSSRHAPKTSRCRSLNDSTKPSHPPPSSSPELIREWIEPEQPVASRGPTNLIRLIRLMVVIGCGVFWVVRSSECLETMCEDLICLVCVWNSWRWNFSNRSLKFRCNE